MGLSLAWSENSSRPMIQSVFLVALPLSRYLNSLPLSSSPPPPHTHCTASPFPGGGDQEKDRSAFCPFHLWHSDPCHGLSGKEGIMSHTKRPEYVLQWVGRTGIYLWQPSCLGDLPWTSLRFLIEEDLWSYI